MRRLSGPLLMATGVLHVLAGVLVLHRRPLTGVVRDGFFGAVKGGGSGPSSEREATVWFVMFGLLASILGGLARWAQTRTGTLPAFLGWSVLALSSVGLVLMPRSGFWAVLPQGVIMILSARRGPS